MERAKKNLGKKSSCYTTFNIRLLTTTLLLATAIFSNSSYSTQDNYADVVAEIKKMENAVSRAEKQISTAEQHIRTLRLAVAANADYIDFKLAESLKKSESDTDVKLHELKSVVDNSMVKLHVNLHDIVSETEVKLEKQLMELSQKISKVNAFEQQIEDADKKHQQQIEKAYKKYHNEFLSIRIDEKLINNAITRISNKDNDNYVTGLSSGEIANNLEIWSCAGYQAINETASTTKDEDYDKITAKIFSLGFDTMLNSQLLLGLSYGYGDSDAKVYDSETRVKKGKDNIKTNSIIAYIDQKDNLLNTSVALMYANNKHNDQEGNAVAKYNSNVIELELDINRSFILGSDNSHRSKNLNSTFAFGAKVNVAGIRTDAYINKLAKDVAEQHNTFVTLGLEAAYTNKLKLAKDMQLYYKLATGYNHVIYSGDKEQGLNILPSTSDSRMKVKQRDPSNDNFVVDLSCSLQINHHFSLKLSGNYTIGNAVKTYGTTAGLHYHF